MKEKLEGKEMCVAFVACVACVASLVPGHFSPNTDCGGGAKVREGAWG